MHEELNLGVYQTMCGVHEGRYRKTANCNGCIYHGEHHEMGATMVVCIREADLGKAVAACENSAKCENKLTLPDVEKLKAEHDARETQNE